MLVGSNPGLQAWATVFVAIVLQPIPFLVATAVAFPQTPQGSRTARITATAITAAAAPYELP